MAEEQQTSKAKEFFEQHGEKAAVGGAALLLLAYLVAGVLMGGDDPSVSQMNQIAQNINVESGKSHENAAQLQAPFEKVSAEALDPWTKISSADKGSDWAGTVFTMVDIEGKEGAKVEVKSIKVPEVKGLKADVGFDGVVLTWDVGEVDEKKFEKADVKEFVVQKKDEGAGWKDLKTVDVKAMTHHDKEIKPKSKYEYRVTPKTDSKKYRDSVRSTGLGDPSPPVAITTLGIWKLTIILLSRQGEEMLIRFEIEKFDAKYGKVKIQHNHKVGEIIGLWEETPGAGPVSEHTAHVEGKSVKVDWNTTSKLEKVTEKRLKIKRIKCQTIYDSSGGKVRCDQKTEEVPFTTTEIIYTDPDDGRKIVVLRPDPKEDPRTADDLCEEHGGKKKEPVVVDPAVAEKKKKEKDAEKLYDEAEKLHDEWEKLEKDKKPDAAKKKGESLEKFKKVMSDFGGTDFATKKKKTIEERIKKLGG